MSVAPDAQWRLDGRVKTEAESKDEGAHTHGFNVSRGGVLEVGGSASLGGSVRVLGELVVQTEGDATFKLLCLGEAGQVRWTARCASLARPRSRAACAVTVGWPSR